MRFLPDREDLSVAVIGMGYVGSALAAVLAGEGLRVVGVDVDPVLVAELGEGHCRFREPGLPELIAQGLRSGRLRVTTDYDAVTGADVVIVAVGTPVTGRRLDDSHLRAACTALAARLGIGQLVLLKSTVPPGVSRSVAAPLLERGGLSAGVDFGLAFCPERLSEGQALAELRTFPIAVGGWSADSTAAAAAFWRRALGTDVLACASMESAELVKLAGNWWIDHNIALANELARLCATRDVDVLEVIAAANTMRKGAGHVNILLPSVGVGGSCLTKDPWMAWRSARDSGLELRTVPVAREVNDAMPDFTAGLIEAELSRLGVSVAGSKVAVFGAAFKNNTGDLRATPVLPVVNRLRRAGAEIALYDPLAEPSELEDLFALAPAKTVEEALTGAACIAVLARHDVFDEVDFVAYRNIVAAACVIVDGRAYYSRETIDRFRRHGFGYRGIGR
jgi:dTDP-alpha-D-glucose dehydrogenase